MTEGVGASKESARDKSVLPRVVINFCTFSEVFSFVPMLPLLDGALITALSEKVEMVRESWEMRSMETKAHPSSDCSHLKQLSWFQVTNLEEIL